MQCLLTTHAFDYIVLRINPGLTCCKDLATIVNNSLLVPAKLATFYHIDIRMSGIINLCFYRSHAYYCIAVLIQSAYKK